MSRKITVFDTTLRDGEQAPGASLSLSEKMAIAHQLARLGVDVMEAGFPISSPADFEAVRLIASEVEGPVICALCRATEKDIEVGWKALCAAPKPRVHTFIGTSDLHIIHKFKSTRDEVLRRAVNAVRFARERCADVEFSAEDATRTEPEFLREVVEAVIEAGATTVNLPDTVGYTLPWLMEAMIRDVIENVPNASQTVISVHNHNDLGLATANSMEAIMAGAGQVECTINGIGERAGNASLEEVVMAIRTHAETLGCHTGILTQHLGAASKMVSNYTGFVVAPNKAIVGANAFRHEAGIHQHGVLQDRRTYEIMNPADVGWRGEQSLTLGPRSGKHGVRARLEALGYTIDDDQLEAIYQRFIALAEAKKQVYDEDLDMMMLEAAAKVPEAWTLVSLSTVTGGGTKPYANVTLKRSGVETPDVAQGNGPVDACFQAINRVTGMSLEQIDYGIRSVSRGGDSVGEATVHVRRDDGKEAVGRATDTDVVKASALAYINAVNRLIVHDAAEVHRQKQ